MTIYNVDNTSGAGRPCRLIDAKGEEILWAVWCDTETGEVITLRHEEGKFVLDNTGTELIRDTHVYPAPLRIEPIPLS